MPDGFYGDMLGKLVYSANTGYLPLEETRDDDIRNRRALSSTTGSPVLYAIIPLSGDNARRWELMVWPTPDAALTVTGRCRLYPNRLIELTDRPAAGFQFDAAIIASAMSQAEIQREDGGTEKQDPVKTHTILVYEKQDGTIGLGLKYHDNDNFIAAVKEDKDNFPYTSADKAVNFMLKIAIAHFDNLTEFVSPTGELLPVTRDEERGVVLVGKGASQDNPSKVNNLMDFSGGAPSGGKH
jgi:hypothetical protein